MPQFGHKQIVGLSVLGEDELLDPFQCFFVPDSSVKVLNYVKCVKQMNSIKSVLFLHLAQRRFDCGLLICDDGPGLLSHDVEESIEHLLELLRRLSEHHNESENYEPV